MHAEVDGQRLSEQEFGSFFILLVAAGNETTRNAISHGMKALYRLARRAAQVAGGLRGVQRRPPSRRSCAGRRR
jgi:cytochrome P450